MTLDKLKKKAVQNIEQWHENEIDKTIIDLIEIIGRLIEASEQNLTFREVLAFHQILAGIAVKDSEQSTLYLKKAVKLMEGILEVSPQHLMDPNKANFRKDMREAHAILWQSDQENSDYHTLEFKRLRAKYPELGMKKKGILAPAFFWTESRLQNLIYLKDKKSMTYEQASKHLGGAKRNQTIHVRSMQSQFRADPNVFTPSRLRS